MTRRRTMHVVWVDEAACRGGGAERYVSDTAARLRERGIRSTLLYNVASAIERDTLASFEGAYPQVQLAEQLRALAPDVIYAHRVADESAVLELATAGAPVVRFFHDHKLFCLRETKITTIGQRTCTRPAGLGCYTCLGFVQPSPAPAWLPLKFTSLGGLRRAQDANRALAAYVVGSGYMRDHVAAHGFDRARIHVLPLYAQVSEAPAKTRRERDLVLFAGRLLPGKGVDVLIRAIAVTRSRARLLIAGEGSAADDLRALAASLGLDARVEFAGRMAAAELTRLRARARCLAMPSRFPETFGLSGLEALSSGLPVIASDVGGIGEWLEDGRNGLAVPPGDVARLSAAIDQLVSDDALARAMGHRASASHRERFLPEHHLDGLEALLRSMMRGEAS